jgi:phosphopantetheinyl transferase (holo-ACP synthase)
MRKKAQGKDLIFISRILRDGSGTEPVDMDMSNQFIANEKYKLIRLSISHDTYIASAFNSYVVKIKEK